MTFSIIFWLCVLAVFIAVVGTLIVRPKLSKKQTPLTFEQREEQRLRKAMSALNTPEGPPVDQSSMWSEPESYPVEAKPYPLVMHEGHVKEVVRSWVDEQEKMVHLSIAQGWKVVVEARDEEEGNGRTQTR